MSKKIFFIVLTCCFLVATFCVSFAGAPQVQHAPANVRAVLDRPDCLAAPLIVPPIVEQPLMDVVISADQFDSDTFFKPVLYEGDFSYVPSGFYSLNLITSSVSSFTIFFDADDVGTFSFVNLNVLGDVTSSVSLFTLLYTDYSTVLISCENELVSMEFGTVDGQTFYVSGNIRAFYFRLAGAYSLSIDGDTSPKLYVMSPDYPSVIEPVISTFVSGLRSLGTNVGRAFSTMANSIFINADGSGLSTFGILVVVFAAISLGLSLTRWVLNFVTSWGNRNR